MYFLPFEDERERESCKQLFMSVPFKLPGGGGMNWEIGIDIRTLLCIK